MGLVQPATRRPEGTHALSAPPDRRIGSSSLKWHVNRPRRTWTPSVDRRLHARFDKLLDQSCEQGPLSAAVAPDHSVATTFTGTCSAYGRARTLPQKQHTSHLLGRRHRDNRHGTGKTNSWTGLHGTGRLCRTDHAETVTGLPGLFGLSGLSGSSNWSGSTK